MGAGSTKPDIHYIAKYSKSVNLNKKISQELFEVGREFRTIPPLYPRPNIIQIYTYTFTIILTNSIIAVFKIKTAISFSGMVFAL